MLLDELKPDIKSIPMDAKILVRLPLDIMRRIYPEQKYSDIEVDFLNDNHQPIEMYFWQFEETAFSRRFYVLRMLDVRCDDCDGAGEFDHGSHWYECQECEGSGLASPGDLIARAEFDCLGSLIQINYFN